MPCAELHQGIKPRFASRFFLIMAVLRNGGSVKSRSLVIASILLVVQLVFSATAVAAVPSTERDALIAFYNSTGGPGWGNSTNWLGAAGTECSWFGVVCSPGDANVVVLNVSNNNIEGAIPPEIGDLTELESLLLYSNQLSGRIPQEIGTMTMLTSLSLAGNQLIGGIPPELGSLTVLASLRIGNNQLGGSIPPDLGALTNLVRFDAHNNRLTGAIPPELGSLVNLEQVRLWGNGLSGQIPAALADISTLIWVDFADNELSGPIPAGFGNCSNLNGLILVGNDLDGAIPPELGTLPALGHLDLAANRLTGGIPSELGDLSNLGFLGLGDNQLTGQIPPELGNLAGLNDLHMQNNHFSGPIPPEMGNLTALGALNLRDNNLTGSIPPELGNLASLGHLDLAGNHLFGPIPPAIGNLANLGYLNLESNVLSGPIPPEIGNLSNLGELFLGWNRLSGPIPPELENLASLSALDLQRNHLEGLIPPEFGNLGNLQWMNLRANNFMGPVPSAITNLVLLGDGGSDIVMNGLYSGDPGVVAFLDAKCGPQWKEIQTVVPDNLGAIYSTGLSATLAWDPIPFNWDAGGYDIYVSESASGPFLHHGRAIDKNANSWTLFGLLPGTTYHFKVSAVTEAGAENQNTVVSELSPSVNIATTSVPSTWFVASSGLLSNDCATIATPCPTITSALDLAGPGEEVRVAAGTYHENIHIDEPVMLVGEDAVTTVLDGHGWSPVLQIHSEQQANVSGLTIQGGQVEAGGGIFVSWRGHLELEDAVVTGNWADNGGGIFVDCEASASLEMVSILENTAGQIGGGIGGCGAIVVSDGAVSLNSAPWGGGIATHGTTQISRTTIANNTAVDFGGGGVLNDGFMQISNSTVSGNSATHGGGLANGRGANMTVENTTVSGNSGGGVFNDKEAVVGLDGCTVAYNTGADTEHSGVMNWDQLLLHNTIVAGNLPVNCANPVRSHGYNLEDGSGCGFDGPGDLSNTDPLLGLLADNGGSTLTHALPGDSPAVDAGDPAAFFNFDQRGFGRPVDGDLDGIAVVDVGSVEFVGPIFADGFETGDSSVWSGTSP